MYMVYFVHIVHISQIVCITEHENCNKLNLQLRHETQLLTDYWQTLSHILLWCKNTFVAES